MDKPKRKCKRKKLNREIAIRIPEEQTADMKGLLVDISREGLGLSTTYPLKPGQLIEVLTVESVLTGKVMWTLKDDTCFRSGIYLINIKNKLD